MIWSSGDLTHVSVCCTSSVMDQPLTNATSFRENIRVEWTPGSRLSVIDFNSHVVHVIIIRTLFTLGQFIDALVRSKRGWVGEWVGVEGYLCSQPEFQNPFFRVLKGSHMSVSILLPLPSSLWQYKPIFVSFQLTGDVICWKQYF